MRVRLLQGLAHPETSRNAGEVLDFADDEAVRLIEAGFAVPHGERAAETPEKPRKAVEKRAPARKRAKRPAKKK